MAWGRPRTCECGDCARCRHRERERQRYQALSFEDRKAIRDARQASRNVEVVRARERARYEQRRLDPTARERQRAVSSLWKAVRDGRVIRQPCEVCGNLDVQGHHDDYSKQLDVRWLCRQHHADEHRRAA